MIPVKLEIQGLYSYKEPQTVHFNQLTGAGLFGIFGAVGSGKSSILEGILLALYGSTERLSDRGEKGSMLNLQSNQLVINFEFLGGKNNQQTFLARYAAKRNSKDPEKVDPAEHTFYERIQGEWIPIESEPERLVGMKKEHFKQTVIIPQGKFREFIDLTPGPRAEMMKELFGLERFDLSGKTAVLFRKVKDEKIRIDTQLQNLEGFQEELLEEKNSQLQQIQTQLKEASAQVDFLSKQVKEREKLQEKFSEWKKFGERKQELIQQKPEIEEKRQLHKEFILAKTYLRPIWNQLKETKADSEKFQVSMNESEGFKKTFKETIDQLIQEEQELKVKNQQRPERESKVRDLKKVIELKSLHQNLADAKQKIQSLEPSIQSLKSEQSALEKNQEELEAQAAQHTNPDTNLLSELKTSLQSWKDLEEQEATLTEILTNFQKEEKQVLRKLEDLQHKIPANFPTPEAWLDNQRKTIRQIEDSREQLMKNLGLNAHAHLLQDGQPCPLCGSKEHPNPLESEKQELQLREKEQELKSAKEESEKILLIIQQRKEEQLHLENHQNNIKVRSSEIAQVRQKLETLKSSLEKHAIQTISELKSRIEGLAASNQAREKLLIHLQESRKKWQDNRAKLEKAQQEFQQAQIKHEGLQASILTKKEEIKDPTFCKPFFEKEETDIRQMIAKVERDIENAALEYEGKQKRIQEVREKQAKNEADFLNFQNLWKASLSKIEKLETEYKEAKKQHGFENEEELIRLYEHSLDAEKVAKQIQQFDQQMALVESRILELEQIKELKNFKEEEFLQLNAELQLKKSEEEEIQQTLTLLREEIKTISVKIQEKKKLELEHAKLEKRAAYLKELEGLFKGSGFVKYVSSIYLKELCHTANQRFMKLSKNSLSLEIDENNTFWVVDYLNGGKRRLLKTLSGGQTFQASLCLALALAEKVKALNQADQSFFFLDEGFGALDITSLRVVFETLKSLRHENRIVGIISHVEELQQEIGAFAQIVLDPEKGSQVSYSF
ncbi:MAG TPA: recombinase RecF [Algoriphagus sp.]|jgi:exonuclease SbcC|uniref:AAA family ATPase n=1 Tax=unclassified Algoriphagus TaxID=2641541 RepID=UPI000EC661E5|nr:MULTISPECIES: SMC family ATPase [unclassified Algoriphagus]HCD88225.1 recombinase RecF [Algoriphagus sp.]|tara:strand:- start:28 stop:3060 length:3033 start_codon:yes stop_codon:yes gene_type:complete